MAGQAQLKTNNGIEYLQCQAPDVSGDFSDLANTYFLADSIAGFDLNKGEGLLNWKRYRLAPPTGFQPQRLLAGQDEDARFPRHAV